jgi:hypothetical protein
MEIYVTIIPATFIASVAQLASAFGCYRKETLIVRKKPEGWWFEPTQGRHIFF